MPALDLGADGAQRLVGRHDALIAGVGVLVQVQGGGISTIVYLMGDATPRQPGEITFLEQSA